MNVYLRAAELLVVGDFTFSCAAIEAAGGSAAEYALLFRPENSESISWLKWTETGLDAEEQKEFRLTALCLMSAIVSYRKPKRRKS